MPRRTIQFVQGCYYHIYNRGAGRQSIFYKDDDYLRCLRTLKTVALECRVTVIAYCLMPNHYHWLVRQDSDISAGEVPKRVFGSYSQAFNLIYKRRGTIFEDRFKARLVSADDYLRHLCRYIHSNPVKDGFAVTPELWPYSNYQDWIGQRKGQLLDRKFIQTFFPEMQQYQASVLDYLTSEIILPPNIKAYLNTLWD